MLEKECDLLHEKAKRFTQKGHHDKALDLIRSEILVKRETIAEFVIQQDPDTGHLQAAQSLFHKLADYLVMLTIFKVKRDIEQGLKLIEEMNVLIKKLTTERRVKIDDGILREKKMLETFFF